MTIAYIMYGISLITIILGFVALLTQKIYINPETHQPTEIDIPFLGKLRTNIPAIAFVFFGFILAYVTFDKSYPPNKVDWIITGSFNAGDEEIDWEKGTLVLFPTEFSHEVSDHGTFIINAKIEEGTSFENMIQRIDFSHPKASTQICPKDEYDSFKNGKVTLIESTTENTRNLKPAPLNFFDNN